jgi:hypothetical protein
MSEYIKIVNGEAEDVFIIKVSSIISIVQQGMTIIFTTDEGVSITTFETVDQRDFVIGKIEENLLKP